ncbi:MAG: PH domain-containing protein [Planctomycetes bacterium]|nr:PH domain-containing protein [Planctomycetota bacterium]
MICKKCGATISDDSDFCNKCGSKIGESAEQAQTDEEKSPIEQLADREDQREEADEKEGKLWEGRPSWKAFGHWFVGLLALGIIFLILFIVIWAKNLSGLRIIGYAELAIWFILFAVLLVKVLKRKLTLKYRITTERLFIERGFLSKAIDEAELIRVDDVLVKQNIIQRAFNVGDVLAKTPTDTTDQDQLLIGIEDPINVKEMIRENARRLRKKGLHIEQL